MVEDRFVAGRPAWEEVGVQMVSNVAPYEFMKLRLLNGSYLAIAGLGRLAGYVQIDETMRDPDIRAYMCALMDRETGPTLPAVPGVDLAAYKAQLLDRFANVAIQDTVERVNADAPVNVLLDPIRDRLMAAASVDLLALGLAAWMRRASGLDDTGRPLSVAHPLAAVLRERSTAGGPDPRPLLGIKPIFGGLGEEPSLVSSLERWLGSLYAIGSKSTLAHARTALSF